MNTIDDHPAPFPMEPSSPAFRPGVRRGVLAGLALGVLALGGCALGPSTADRTPLITADDLREMLDLKAPLVLVYACPGTAESKPRIPGSVLAREFLGYSASLPRDLDIILYCGCAGDEAAHLLATRLRGEGFTSIHVLSGGILAWIRAGYPLSPGETPIHNPSS